MQFVLATLLLLGPVSAARSKGGIFSDGEGNISANPAIDICSKKVKGALLRNSVSWLWRQLECKCPFNYVVSGSHPICQKKWDNYDRYFDQHDDDGLPHGECECKHRPGCGIVQYEADQVLPTNAAKVGLPTPVAVGTPHDVNTGVFELDQMLYGVWWMMDNPVPEELATFSGTHSMLTKEDGSRIPTSQVDWANYNLTFSVDNSRHNRWAWPDTWTAKNAIMRTYTSALEKSNNFTMFNETRGEVHTDLKSMPLVWVEAWWFDIINEHQWKRTTEFQSGSLFSDNVYTLTRIVDENSQPTVHWDTWLGHMRDSKEGGQKLLVWDSDDSCKRKCMLGGSSCTDCHKKCSGN